MLGQPHPICKCLPLAIRRRLLMIFMITAQSFIGCGTVVSTRESNSRTETATFPIQARIDLGVIEQGEFQKFSQWIRNRSDQTIQIAKLETTCDCLEAHISVSQLEASEKALICLSYDATKEPDFVGALQVEIRLINNLGDCVGKIEVPLDVVPRRSAD